MREWWYRFRFALLFRRATHFEWSACWSVAWAGDYDPSYSVEEAVEAELDAWSDGI